MITKIAVVMIYYGAHPPTLTVEVDAEIHARACHRDDCDGRLRTEERFHGRRQALSREGIDNRRRTAPQPPLLSVRFTTRWPELHSNEFLDAATVSSSYIPARE